MPSALDSTTLLIVVVLIVALVVALVANRWIRPRITADTQGIRLEAMIVPIVTITVLLLAFSLVAVLGGFQRAQQAAHEEARKVDNVYESATYLKSPQREIIQSAMVCYARAVTNHEWPAMRAGGTTAPEVGVWSAQSQSGLQAAIRADNDLAGLVTATIAADRERGESRGRRLDEGAPAVPDIVKFLFLFCAAMALLVLGAFTLPSVGRRVQVVVLVAVASVLIMFLVTIEILDEPFNGPAQIPPTTIARIADTLAGQWASEHPGTPLPCDQTGVAQ